MKFEIDAGELSRAAALAASVVNSKNTLPCLSFCLIETSGDQLSGELSLMATNLDQSLRLSARGTVTEPGAVLLPVAFLSAYARTLASGTNVKIDAPEDGGAAIIAARGAKHKAQTVPVEDFPVVPDGLALEPNENQQAALAQIVIEAGELARMLDMTAMAVSHESASQTCLSGVLCRWEKTDGVPRFIMVGTDTHRLTKYQARDSSVIGGMIDGGGNQPGGNYDVIVPGEALGNWKKILDACKDDAPVTLSASDKLFQIEATNTQGNAVKFISRIMDGQFPNYEKVIPKAGRGFGFNIEEMQSALQRLALTQPKGNKIIFTLMAGGDASGKILRLTATGEVNTADEDLDVVPELANSNDATGAWEEVHWGLTIIYMRAFLGAAKASLDGKTALMYSSQSAKGFSALSPFSFQIIDGDNEVLDGMTHILMPMQV